MNQPAAPFAVDRPALAQAFNRAGAGYDAVAWLQQRARAELLERLQYFELHPRLVLDLGAGTCWASAALAHRYPQARVLALDLAAGMLAAAPRRWWRPRRFARVCADAHALPLADHSVDLIYSNLMLQWCERPERLFVELSRVLRPDALLCFSSFGPDSLQELRTAWAEVDGGVHVGEFTDMPQLAAALMQSGFVEPVMDVERHVRHYADVYALMRELKCLGAHNVATARARGLTGRRRMCAMIEAYEHCRTQQGLPATYQLIFGAAFRAEAASPSGHTARGHTAPAQAAQAQRADVERAVPIEALRRRRRPDR